MSWSLKGEGGEGGMGSRHTVQMPQAGKHVGTRVGPGTESSPAVCGGRAGSFRRGSRNRSARSPERPGEEVGLHGVLKGAFCPGRRGEWRGQQLELFLTRSSPGHVSRLCRDRPHQAPNLLPPLTSLKRKPWSLIYPHRGHLGQMDLLRGLFIACGFSRLKV